MDSAFYNCNKLFLTSLYAAISPVFPNPGVRSSKGSPGISEGLWDDYGVGNKKEK